MNGFHEFVPQLYRSTFSDFASQLIKVERGLSSSSKASQSVIAGLRCNGDGSPTSWDNLERMLTRSHYDSIGISVWYSVCLTTTYPDEPFVPNGTDMHSQRMGQQVWAGFQYLLHLETAHWKRVQMPPHTRKWKRGVILWILWRSVCKMLPSICETRVSLYMRCWAGVTRSVLARSHYDVQPLPHDDIS